MQKPTILTLDAGGTTLTFSAVQSGEQVGKTIKKRSYPDDLSKFLSALKEGFAELSSEIAGNSDAISFAFPGPADYKNGVIGDLPNLPAFRGGVALGPYLEEQFGIPVFIHNDGDMFAYGEAKAGFLPYVNQKLEEAGSQKRYSNLIGVTLGTGFGVGISINGKLLEGDTNSASEAWLIRNKVHNYTFVEDILSRKAVMRMYAEQIHMDPEKAPEPFEIYQIARAEKEGVREAAVETFLRYGEVLGDAIAHILTLTDGVIVIGGGLSGAYPLFKNSMMDELNGFYNPLSGKRFRRLIQQVYNVEDDRSLRQFLASPVKSISIPGSEKKVPYEFEKKTCIGLTRCGTSEAISLGCYYYAAGKLS